MWAYPQWHPVSAIWELPAAWPFPHCHLSLRYHAHTSWINDSLSSHVRDPPLHLLCGSSASPQSSTGRVLQSRDQLQLYRCACQETAPDRCALAITAGSWDFWGVSFLNNGALSLTVRSAAGSRRGSRTKSVTVRIVNTVNQGLIKQFNLWARKWGGGKKNHPRFETVKCYWSSIMHPNNVLVWIGNARQSKAICI